MDITIIGTGYVGLVSGTCFAEMGVTVHCIDTDIDKIENLKKGIIPIYEPGLETLVLKNMKAERLFFSTNLLSVLDKTEVIFIAVGTPPNDDGSADLQFVRSVAQSVGEYMESYKLLVTKSTVPVGTSQEVKSIVRKALQKRGKEIPFDVASNPEFLKEGDAINDFMSPDRVVVGVDSQRAREVLTKLYRPFLLNNFRVLFMDIPSAEMTKYAANSMLATRISFMNDIANLCQLVGADINMVRKGIGTDARIGSKFLYAGTGYGGSCFPKDVKALISTAKTYDYQMRVLEAVEAVNENQKTILIQKLKRHWDNNMQGKTVALWGIAFKPNTNDIREAPSLLVLRQLLEMGVRVRCFDPIAIPAIKDYIQHCRSNKQKGQSGLDDNQLYFATDIYDTTFDTDAILLLTEWKEFRMPNWHVIRNSMRGNLVLDGRNIYDKDELSELGFIYEGIGV